MAAATSVKSNKSTGLETGRNTTVSNTQNGTWVPPAVVTPIFAVRHCQPHAPPPKTGADQKAACYTKDAINRLAECEQRLRTLIATQSPNYPDVFHSNSPAFDEQVYGTSEEALHLKKLDRALKSLLQNLVTFGQADCAWMLSDFEDFNNHALTFKGEVERLLSNINNKVKLHDSTFTGSSKTRKTTIKVTETESNVPGTLPKGTLKKSARKSSSREKKNKRLTTEPPMPGMAVASGVPSQPSPSNKSLSKKRSGKDRKSKDTKRGNGGLKVKSPLSLRERVKKSQHSSREKVGSPKSSKEKLQKSQRSSRSKVGSPKSPKEKGKKNQLSSKSKVRVSKSGKEKVKKSQRSTQSKKSAKPSKSGSSVKMPKEKKAKKADGKRRK